MTDILQHDEEGRIQDHELNRLAVAVSRGDDSTFGPKIIAELLREIDATRTDVVTLDRAWVGATHPFVDNEAEIEELRRIRPVLIERATR